LYDNKFESDKSQISNTSANLTRFFFADKVLLSFQLTVIERRMAQPGTQSREFTLRPWRLERSGRLEKTNEPQRR